MYKIDFYNKSKTCNLSTVKNTSSEARRDTIGNVVNVEYYYIELKHDIAMPCVPTWRTLRGVIETIWETLLLSDLVSLNGLYICAYMSNGTHRPVRFIKVDGKNKEMRICRVS